MSSPWVFWGEEGRLCNCRVLKSSGRVSSEYENSITGSGTCWCITGFLATCCTPHSLSQTPGSLHAEVILTCIQQAYKNSPVSNWNSLHQLLLLQLLLLYWGTNNGGYIMWLLKQGEIICLDQDSILCAAAYFHTYVCVYWVGNGSCDGTVGCMWFPWLKYISTFLLKAWCVGLLQGFLRKAFQCLRYSEHLETALLILRNCKEWQ